jgi:hypothetical protein
MEKSEVLETLGSDTFDWLKAMKASKVPGHPVRAKSGSERTRLVHIRKVAKREIANLTTLAELLPEDQLNQVFTEEQLLPLFNAIFKLDESSQAGEELLEKKRKRLLSLCYQVITLLDYPIFSEKLAGQLHAVTAMEGGALPGIRAIYYRNMVPEPKRKLKIENKKMFEKENP